jgi:hypothetical protein
MSCSDAGKAVCNDECCRKIFNTEFCDIESNCVTTPTWIIILVPILLGLAALILLGIVLYRLRTRKVMDRYIFVRNQTSKLTKPYIYHNSVEKNLKLKEHLGVELHDHLFSLGSYSSFDLSLSTIYLKFIFTFFVIFFIYLLFSCFFESL